MNDTGVVDQFLNTFTTYIDSGFGLLGGEVHFLSATLVLIDVTLAALFWAWAPGEDILARLIKKTLYVGFFAFLIGNFNNLAKIVFESFSGLGLKASGSAMSASDFLHPGKIAQTGLDAGMPILTAMSQMAGFPGLFTNFVQIVVMLLAWLIVLIAFFVLAVQLFITLIEFKLTTLAGFVLVPFGLFGKTAFLAEKVLGNVVASGVKVLVLAVIVGIGSTLFGQFTTGAAGAGSSPNLEQVLALALAALTLLGLGIFGPGIATGLVSGAPQLGAGAAVGTAMTVGGLAFAGAMGARAIAGGAGALAGGAGGGAAGAGATSRPGPTGSGDPGHRPPSPPAGGGRSGPAPQGAAASPPPPPIGGGGGSPAVGGAGTSGAAADTADAAPEPAWARHLRTAGHAAQTAAHAIPTHDGGGAGAQVSLFEDD
ncbi:MAG TPA: P-type conjugative transfer protein TrbL [Caulobacteraceae bacterium]